MAGPITHILLALKLFNIGMLDSNTVDIKQFLVGTSFPDIRYLGVIERHKTHPAKISWNEIKNEQSSFTAGLKFHALIDQIREEFMIKNNAYELFDKNPLLSQCLKLTEDKFLYNKLNDWQLIASLFDDILKEELAFDITKKDIEKWHLILKWYFSQPIKEDILVQVLQKFLPSISSKANQLSTLAHKIEHNKTFEQLTYLFYDSFQDLLKNY
ncbi:MAG: hypothetical protein WDZ41_01860 [Candidatus Babeliales bacterium]